MLAPLVLMLVVSAASEDAGPPSATNAAGPLRPGLESSTTQEPQRIRSRVDALLGTNGPIGAARWRSLGPGAAPILEEIAGDNRALPTRRARALHLTLTCSRSPGVPLARSSLRCLSLVLKKVVLGFLNTHMRQPRGRQRPLEKLVDCLAKILVRLAQSQEETFVVRLAAVRGVGRTLSPSRQLKTLRPVLEGAQDAHLRAVAAEVLAQHTSGCPVVRAQLEREGPETRAQFEGARQRCFQH